MTLVEQVLAFGLKLIQMAAAIQLFLHQPLAESQTVNFNAPMSLPCQEQARGTFESQG